MDASQKFVGRETSVKALAAGLLNQSSKNELIDILSISGQGGVGKSYLLDYTIDNTDLENQKYLILRLSGPTETENTPRTFSELITKELIAKCPTDAAKEPFKRLKKCKKIIEKLDKEARERLAIREKDTNEAMPAEVRELLLKLGLGIVELVSNEYFASYVSDLLKKNPAAVEHSIKYLAKTLSESEEKGFISKITEAFESEVATKLRTPAPHVLREVLAAELAADLADLFEEQQAKLKKYSRLLLILDDYEFLSDALGSFLFTQLIPQLYSKKIETVIVILCRDAFYNVTAHLGAKDKVREFIRVEINLEPFTEEEAKKYIVQAGIKDENTIAKIILDTECLPFLLESEVHAHLAGEKTALALESYYARITRWMSPFQREWLDSLSFLEIINENSIKAMLPDEDAKSILSWVKSDPSVRSSKHKYWTIKKPIRSCVQERMVISAPDTYDELKDKADKINHETLERQKKYEKVNAV